MKILIVSATFLETKNILLEFKCIENKDTKMYKILYRNHKIHLLIAGIGIPSTIYMLTKAIIHEKYDLVINIGICGSFEKSIEIGSTIIIQQEEFADLGIEDADEFKTLFDMKFLSASEFPFVNKKLNCNFTHLPHQVNTAISELQKVNGITVNTAHGNDSSIFKMISKFNPDVESMEGAAVFFVCLSENIPFFEIRSISNYVEKRNKANWNINLAIQNLTNVLKKIIDKI